MFNSPNRNLEHLEKKILGRRTMGRFLDVIIGSGHILSVSKMTISKVSIEPNHPPVITRWSGSSISNCLSISNHSKPVLGGLKLWEENKRESAESSGSFFNG